MPTYERSRATEFREIDRWSDGVGWLSHPDEIGRRASHAVRGDDGVWLFDPLDAPGIDDAIADVGTVAGVAVLSDYHARDASAFADRHGVSIYIPSWFNRVEDRVNAPIERYSTELGQSGFHVFEYTPFPGWREGIAYRETDGTLYVPDVVGTAPLYTVNDERLGVYLLQRLFPPRDVLGGLDPDRIIVGHGVGVFENATAILSNALDGARRRFPTALVENGGEQLRALIGALDV